MSIDIVSFDPATLDIPPLLEAIKNDSQPDGWTVQAVHRGEHSQIYRADPTDAEQFPSLTIKVYHTESELAVRAYHAMAALFDFGVSLGPRPFFFDEHAATLDAPVLVCQWLPGEPLTVPPAVDDEEMWHRIMSGLGVPKNLPFAKHVNQIPLKGSGPQQPGDVLQMLDDELAKLPAEHPLYETLANLVSNAHERTPQAWNIMPRVGLSRLEPHYNHFIWDGYHLRVVGFERIDWADVAFDVGMMCAHPLYEEVALSHWVWFRWEYARLTKDESFTARATVYTHLMQVYYAIQLTLRDEPKQRDRMIKRAQRNFL